MIKTVTVNGGRFTDALRLSLVVVVIATFGTPDTVHGTPGSSERVGVLVIAHGGSNQWNAAVRHAVKQVTLEYPTEIAFGMGMHPEEVRAFQQAVDRLERKGVRRLVVVPLLVSSHSEVFRQFEYLFGLREKAEWPDAGKPLSLEVPVVMGHALDDDPVVADILLERARRLSRTPQQETVILAAHGPNDEADNQQWLSAMQRLANQVKQGGRFREVACVTLRDDAPTAIQETAAKAFRERVQHAGQEGRALVVPVLIAPGGVERKIPKLLAGLSYIYTGETLLPHQGVAGWLAQQATRLANEQQPRVAERHSSTLLVHQDGEREGSAKSSTVLE